MPINPPAELGIPGIGAQQLAAMLQQIQQQQPDVEIPAFESAEDLLKFLTGLLGGSSSGGGGFSFGGGGSAPVDPTVSAAESFYFQLWGTKPPGNYVKSFINQGHDLFDFMTWQLARPGADSQVFYRDEYARYSSLAAQVMGAR